MRMDAVLSRWLADRFQTGNTVVALLRIKVGDGDG